MDNEEEYDNEVGPVKNKEMKLVYAEKTVRWIKKFIETGKVLDIGTGFGFLPYIAEKMGFKAKGIEINEEKAEWGREQLGVEVKTGDFFTFYTGKKYDIITMNAVLEHFKELQQVVERVHTLLKPEGFLYIEVPRYKTPIREILKEK